MFVKVAHGAVSLTCPVHLLTVLFYGQALTRDLSHTGTGAVMHCDSCADFSAM